MRHEIRNHSGAKSRFLRKPEVLREFLPASQATLWRLIKKGKFPSPQKLGGITFWNRSALEEWADSQSKGK